METKNIFQKKPSASNSWQRSASTQTAPSPEQSVEFSLYAPQARSVSVAGSFNRWSQVNFSLTKNIQGAWKGQIRLKPGRYQYRFFVDGKWMDDPRAKETVSNEFGTQNAIIIVK